VTLHSVARHWCTSSEAELAEIARCRRRLPPIQPGLARRNRDCLNQFEDPAQIRRLASLPERLWRKAIAAPPGWRSLDDAQGALGLAILLAAPIRIRNLAALNIGHSLHLPVEARHDSLIDLAAAETKTGEPFVIGLPPAITSMLLAYRKRLLVPVTGQDSILFCGRGGRPKEPRTLAGLVTRIVRRHLGLAITPYQFRHLAARIVLEHEPAAYETVRQLLGHRNLKTTVNAYAGIDTRRAGCVHQALLAQTLGVTPPARKHRR
jgi:integrase